MGTARSQLRDNVGPLNSIGVKAPIGSGTRVYGVFLMEDGNVFKLYGGRGTPVYNLHIAELDITSRLRNPGVVKTLKFMSRDEIPLDDMAYGLVMERVINDNDTGPVYDTRLILDFVNGFTAMAENGLIHTDWEGGNQYRTKEGFKFVDLNGDQTKFYPLYRFTDDETGRESLSSFFNPDVSSLDDPLLGEQLVADLKARVDSTDPNIAIDWYEIPKHPWVTLVDVPYVQGDEEPPYVNMADWPARHMDYISPISTSIDKIFESKKGNAYLISIFEAVDLYYRFLPFVIDGDNLEDIFITCFGLVESVTPSMFSGDVTTELVPNALKLADRITKSLNGRLRPRNFYHKCWSIEDFCIAWKLIGLKYDDYVNLKCDNFQLLAPPTWNYASFRLRNELSRLRSYNIDPQLQARLLPVMLGKDLTPTLMSDNMSDNICFSKLTSPELVEYLDIMNVEYKHPKEYDDRFYLSDLAKRTYNYYTYNKHLPQRLTPAVKDLLHLQYYDVILTCQYTSDYLTDSMYEELVSMFELDSSSPNLKGRVNRLLRMSYAFNVSAVEVKVNTGLPIIRRHMEFEAEFRRHPEWNNDVLIYLAGILIMTRQLERDPKIEDFDSNETFGSITLFKNVLTKNRPELAAFLAKLPCRRHSGWYVDQLIDSIKKSKGGPTDGPGVVRVPRAATDDLTETITYWLRKLLATQGKTLTDDKLLELLHYVNKYTMIVDIV